MRPIVGCLRALACVPTYVAVLVVASGCGREPARPATGGVWRPVQGAALTPAQAQQRDRALQARGAMFGELMGALQAEMAAGGPAAAIDACQVKAPAIAASTSERSGLRIGRTSWKLRNPRNTAPAWAEPLMQDRAAEPRFSAADDGRLGVLLPITLVGLCVTCHGESESIPTPVKERLAALYPQDQATGFKDGDLRGWFWLEVPPAP